jgi:AcrR family transcriptional regulator
MLMAADTPARRERLAGGGHDQIEHGQIELIQRARIVSAMLDSATDGGAGSVSVADVVERSGVSRRTFYELFDDREDCFYAAFEQALSQVCERVVPAYLGQKSWRERIRAGLVALLGFFDREPQIGRVLIAESLSGGPRALERRGEVVGKLTSILEQGAGEGKTVASPPLTGEGIVGGVLAVIGRRLDQEPHTQMVELANPLMSMIVLPYLGAGAARRELQRATPAVPSAEAIDRSRPSDPFKDAGLRLTYRTVRALMAIAERPGASNRLIGDTAEIKDQGQISKLLGRLEHAGMIANTGLSPGQGAPNAWTLTPTGRQVTDNIRAHTERPSRGERER